jgi:DNA-binding ferritin-like protein (Dps family)
MYFKIKIGGIYKISIGEYYYIGLSVDIFGNRWQSHITDLYMNKHSSVKFQQMFNEFGIESLKFEILEYISKTDIKKETGLKGKDFDNYYRRLLLRKEKEWMNKYSINFSLNKDNKSFSK